MIPTRDFTDVTLVSDDTYWRLFWCFLGYCLALAIHHWPSYIQKTGLACWKILQKIQIFRREIVLERENYQFCNGLRKGQQAYSKTKVSWKVLQNRFLVSDLEFHLRMGGNTHCVTKWMIVYAKFILTQCCLYWISMIYALLTQNFVVRIYALFPQIFLDWKAKSADIFTFWMYDDHQDGEDHWLKGKES